MGESAEIMRVQLLGAFRVWVGERSIEENEWRLRKAASLVKLLALTPGHRLHREQGMDLLWPDSGKKAASNNLRQTLYTARRILDQDAGLRYLRSESESLVLCPEGTLWTDVEAFEATAKTARSGGEPAAYRAAIELYAGDLLPEDRYEGWAEERRSELRLLRLRLLAELAELYEQREDLEEAIEALQEVVASEPSHEEAHVGLMRLYAITGQRYQALTQYERLKQALSWELGTEPGATSRNLYQEIVSGGSPSIRRQAAAPSPAVPVETGRHNLASALTSFIGRERELLEVKRLLAMTRLLTLTGAGGCGKTRLGLEVARDLVGAYPDGVWLVELAALSEAKLVPQAVAAVLGVPEKPDRTLVDGLVDALREKHMLLVLDNCEHLVETCAQLAETLLGLCLRLRVLATSREAMGVAGEVNWAVPSLAIPEEQHQASVDELSKSESVRLFLERARYQRPDFSLTPRKARGVVEICRRLDGIPLAIELAAARVGVLSVQQISARLGDALGLLSAGSRTTIPRHQTLRATLEWSYGLLGEPERRLFERLSVFAGSWTMEATEATCAGDGLDEGSILNLLSRLVDKSLVMAEPVGEDGVRYRMLEPVRQYAHERLAATGKTDRLQRQHAEYFMALAEAAEPELTGQRQVAWLKRLDLDHDNLRAALGASIEREQGLRLCGAVWRFWYVRGYLSEGRRWLGASLARCDKAPSEVRAKGLDGAGWLAQAQGDYKAANALYEEQLALSRESEDEGGTARSLGNLGSVALSQGDYERATVLLEDSLSSLRRLGNKGETISVLSDLGGLASFQDDLERAVAFFEEALTLSREVGDVLGIAVSLGNLGYATLLQADWERSTSLLGESLTLFREVGDRLDIALTSAHLGFAAVSRGDHRRAAGLLEEGLALSHELGDKPSTATSLEGMARVAGIGSRAHRGARLWGAAHALREDIGAPLPSHERALHEPYVAAVRAELGEGVWEALWEEGRKMSLEVAVEYALSEREAAPSARPTDERKRDDRHSLYLTPREEEVAVLVARGLTNRQIASGLSISEHTAATHVTRILRKLGLDSRSQLAAWMIDQGSHTSGSVYGGPRSG